MGDEITLRVYIFFKVFSLLHKNVYCINIMYGKAKQNKKKTTIDPQHKGHTEFYIK